MITSSRQLKDRIRNLSKQKSADAQILMRIYMIERFLERLSLSEYRDKFILKGGTLVAALVGVEARSTMDLDASIKGADISAGKVEKIISAIIAVPVDDGVTFSIKQISGIMDEAEYSGVRVSMESMFDGVKIPLKMDISTGDIITPREVRYEYKMMLEDRTIEVMTYNLETVLAEKLETILSRNILNTRMRDFYDIYILLQVYKDNISTDNLHDAFTATAKKRGTIGWIKDRIDLLDIIEGNLELQELWKSYQKHYSYASDVSWVTVIDAVRALYNMAEV